jgi:hypothetical protein
MEVNSESHVQAALLPDSWINLRAALNIFWRRDIALTSTEN